MAMLVYRNNTTIKKVKVWFKMIFLFKKIKKTIFPLKINDTNHLKSHPIEIRKNHLPKPPFSASNPGSFFRGSNLPGPGHLLLLRLENEVKIPSTAWMMHTSWILLSNRASRSPKLGQLDHSKYTPEN